MISQESASAIRLGFRAKGGGLLRPPGITKRAEIFNDLGPFLFVSLVGVGWRLMVLGPRSGTLVGTLNMPGTSNF